MELADAEQSVTEIVSFVEPFRSELGRSERRRNCSQYLSGLILPAERKSTEPMSERVVGSDAQSLQQFVNQSPWDYRPVQTKLVHLVSQSLRLRKAVILIDDTGLPKKGKHSVGVAHQYCGVLGKVANCQSIVTLAAMGADHLHFPIAAQLYLPSGWTDEPERLAKAGVPKQYWQFQEEWRIAMHLLEHTTLPFAVECVVFDAGYGEIRPSSMR